MTIDLVARYGIRAAAASSDFPFGSPNAESSEGANDGFPFQIDWIKDLMAPWQKIMELAGLTPDGSITADQYLEALFESGIIPLTALGPGDAVIPRGDITLGISPEAVQIYRPDGIEGFNTKGSYHYRKAGTFTSTVNESVIKYTPTAPNIPTWTQNAGVIIGTTLTLDTGGSVPDTATVHSVSLHMTASGTTQYIVPLTFTCTNGQTGLSIHSMRGLFSTDPDVVTYAPHYYLIRFQEP